SLARVAPGRRGAVRAVGAARGRIVRPCLCGRLSYQEAEPERRGGRRADHQSLKLHSSSARFPSQPPCPFSTTRSVRLQPDRCGRPKGGHYEPGLSKRMRCDSLSATYTPSPSANTPCGRDNCTFFGSSANNVPRAAVPKTVSIVPRRKSTRRIT